MTRRKPTVYVAGPVTSSGTQASNLHRALRAANMLAAEGFVPFVPNLFFAWEAAGQTDEFFREQCMEWVRVCDVFVRITGESRGAEAEEKYARELGKPVYVQTERYAGNELTGVHGAIGALRSGKLSHLFTEDPPEPEDYTPRNNRQAHAALATATIVLEPDPEEETRRAIELYTLRDKREKYEKRIAQQTEYIRQLEGAHYNVLTTFQREVAEWTARQPWGASQPAWQPLLGIGEELGELNHAYLKREQGVRGSREKHDAEIRDAVGDILVFLAAFCTAERIDMDDCRITVWNEVKERDYAQMREPTAPAGKPLVEVFAEEHAPSDGAIRTEVGPDGHFRDPGGFAPYSQHDKG